MKSAGGCFEPQIASGVLMNMVDRCLSNDEVLLLGVVVKLAELDIVDHIGIILVEVDNEDDLADATLEATEIVVLGVDCERRRGSAKDGYLELPLKPTVGHAVFPADLCEDTGILVAECELRFQRHIEY